MFVLKAKIEVKVHDMKTYKKTKGIAPFVPFLGRNKGDWQYSRQTALPLRKNTGTH